MNEILARAGALFVAPPAAAPRTGVPPADLVGVLAPARELAAVAGGVAAELRHRHRARAALVCRPGALPAAPAGRAARVLARRLAERDLPVAAAGALCHAAVADAPRDALRALMAVAPHPAVVALTARDPAWDAVLAEADALLLAPAAGSDPAYVELALTSLAALGPPVGLVAAPRGAIARRAAALGLVRVRSEAAGVPT